ncbi:MAG TPA: hypothetical protein VGE07_06560 [Herpetosiphonaceae bacterium]
MAAELNCAISAALTDAIHADLAPPVVDEFIYGAYDLNPGLLTVKYMFADRAALDEAWDGGVCAAIRERVAAALAREGYPARAIPEVHVGFAANDEVSREGGPFKFFR